MTATRPQWLDYTLRRIDAIKAVSVNHARRKGLARRIVQFAEVDDDLFPSPSVWSDEAQCIHLQWTCTIGQRGSLEIVVNKPTSFVVTFWRPGRPKEAMVCPGDYADSVRRIFGEFNGEPMGVSAAEVMALVEVKR